MKFRNNFDLIRLFAATEVMIVHYLKFFPADGPAWLPVLLHQIPGVPTFFFISGLLVSASYERSPALGQYARNRLLRIFPGLWASVAFAAVLIVLAHPIGAGQMAALILAKSTILQDWNPEFLRSYGVGVFNGSLWTIPVELSFYVFLPLAYWVGRKRVDWLLALVAIASFAALILIGNFSDGIVRKAILLTPVPWVGMFCIGVLAHRHFAKLRPLVQGKLLHWLGAYSAVAICSHYLEVPGVLQGGASVMGILNFLALAGLALAAAHTMPDLADRILRRNDISYGVYILHMPVLNALIEAGVGRPVWPGVAITVAAAAASWMLIEKPALRKKPKPLAAPAPLAAE